MEGRLPSKQTYFSSDRKQRSSVGGGVPSDPYLISIGNNVIIAVSVEFVTHDIFYHALNQTYSDLGEFYPHFDTITIEDNVMYWWFLENYARCSDWRRCNCSWW